MTSKTSRVFHVCMSSAEHCPIFFLSIPGNLCEELMNGYVVVAILLASFDMEFGSMSQFAKFSFTFIKV